LQGFLMRIQIHPIHGGGIVIRNANGRKPKVALDSQNLMLLVSFVAFCEATGYLLRWWPEPAESLS